MFEGQPKGLYALALANTGERFGYYTMLAIFTLFLQAKFGFSEATTGVFYSSFLMMAYLTPLFGGMAADRWGYDRLIKMGVFTMFFGYMFLAVPIKGTTGIITMSCALFLIACGTGMFKGNLQVLVGNLYDKAKYSSKRDAGFSIFYMAINIGALFAPTMAVKLTNIIMNNAGLFYDGKIPALAHKFLEAPATMTAENTTALQQAITDQHFVGSMADFCNKYIDTLSLSYNAGFSVACFSLIISFLIYYFFRNTYKDAICPVNSKKSDSTEQVPELSREETRQRITALLFVFFVVIFFWMSFHQNGLSLTYFARDYTQHTAEGINRFQFDVTNLVGMIFIVYGIFALFQNHTMRGKGIGLALIALPVVYIYYNMNATEPTVQILPQIFQQFNPCFVVALTPVSLAIFGALAKRGKEPTAPRKIALGMLVAAAAYCVMAAGSYHMPSPDQVKAGAQFNLASPNLLISTYLILTFGELLLSPMGISFVSKVAPPKYKGTMMGGWFVATAIGNQLVSVTGYLWGALPLWCVWSVLITLCILSFLFMTFMMKRLDKVC
jgi:POT family proton-dependent oligopeptide transporter